MSPDDKDCSRNMEEKQATTVNTETKDAKVPWDVYPRPQMQRASFLNLNGAWDFCVTKGGKLLENVGETVVVPYPVESVLSGVERHFEKGCVLIYRKKLLLPESFRRGRVLLHCSGIDQIAALFVNRQPAGSFITQVDGPIMADITGFLKEGENEIVFQVIDDLSLKIPYGKQKEKHGGMWYTPVSGIWQTVWLEQVPETYIEGLKISATEQEVTIEVQGTGVEEGTILCENETYHYKEGKLTLKPEKPKVWTPEFPFLYYFSVKSGEDEVLSYFALRRVDVREINSKPRLCLNGKPFFFHGVLDQGYFADGIYTPETPESYKKDILTMKSLGFNTLRKHIKVEPEEFYYQCDRLGMFVFQDMVNNGVYHFVAETALPTIGVKLSENLQGLLHKDPLQRRNFLKAMTGTVHRLYNHPSIVYWTIFNEGWGQFEGDMAYRLLKELDPQRIIDTASGWFHTKESDVDSRHVYFRAFHMPESSEKPVILSEFGGYCLKIDGHIWSKQGNYGYRHHKDQEELEKALQELYQKEIVPAAGEGLCGCIYTQLSDVEEEVNGLMTYDREALKIREGVLLEIAEQLKDVLGQGK